MVKASAGTINYDINMDEISALVDSLCEMANVVNTSSDESKKQAEEGDNVA